VLCRSSSWGSAIFKRAAALQQLLLQGTSHMTMCLHGPKQDTCDDSQCTPIFDLIIMISGW
jgi:hypothetical protein